MARIPHSPIGHILPRHASKAVKEAMADTRVVLVNGARQCGKSTMVAQIGNLIGAEWRTLDRAETRQSASYDPSEFVRSDTPLVIDEVQRVPELLLSIKDSVDADPRPGRFLLTGSARVLALHSVPDALPGRIETIELWPLSQGEIEGTSDSFVDKVFIQGPQFHHTSNENREGYIKRVARGGFPGAIAREGKRRQRFLDEYVSDLINREILQLSEIRYSPQLRALIRLLATRVGNLLVLSNLANALGVSRETVEHYLSLLDQVFLIKTIPAWSRNLSQRAVGTPKLAMVDSGIAANLLDCDESTLREPSAPLGQLLEGFVLMELARQLSWAEQRVEMFHYRTKDKVEVDAVLENRRGRAVGIEVKAASTVREEDFRGLHHLMTRLGDDFIVGIVLYTGQQTLPFGPRMRAVPISALWEVAP